MMTSRLVDDGATMLRLMDFWILPRKEVGDDTPTLPGLTIIADPQVFSHVELRT